MGAHDRRVELRRHLGQLRVVTAPRVVEQVGARGAHLAGHLGTPGVDADHHAGMVLADPRHERHHAPDLLRGSDDLAVPGAHAADVDDLGALLHDLVDTLLRRPVVVGRSPVVERVAGAVDDRHHQRRVRPERVPAQPQLHVSDPCSSFGPFDGRIPGTWCRGSAI